MENFLKFLERHFLKCFSFFSLLGLFFFLFLHGQTEEVTPSLPSESQYLSTVVKGNNRFAFALYEKMKSKSGNICFSPYSISSGLAMAAMGAKGETAQQFQQAFHYSLSLLPLMGDMNEAYKSKSGKSTEHFLANALWLQKDLPIIPSFKIVIQRTFHDGLLFLDFAKESSRSIQLINQWVKEKTQGKILSLIVGQDISTKTLFLLTTALYMKGNWSLPFESKEIKRLPFRLSATRAFTTDMMHHDDNYLLWKGEKWDLIVIPFEEGESNSHLALVIILPKELAIDELEKNFTWSNWELWINQTNMTPVSLSLPRFRIEGRFDLQSYLKSLGLSSMFSSNANFSGITQQAPFFVDKAIHKTLFKISESGTETTPLKTHSQKNEKDQNRYEFLADHPFLFVVWDQKTDSILFMGRLNLP